ncbi:hypothetical protein HAX54_014015 [Datura stramonium]|uniref:Uncharacterized protein n=1 Tax=Datura stramonium TaxID=4076 RepID=A0ABS8Y232_DATST|nr:hypothetical protein [Datura stramonium]
MPPYPTTLEAPQAGLSPQGASSSTLASCPAPAKPSKAIYTSKAPGGILFLTSIEKALLPLKDSLVVTYQTLITRLDCLESKGDSDEIVGERFSNREYWSRVISQKCCMALASLLDLPPRSPLPRACPPTTSPPRGPTPLGNPGKIQLVEEEREIDEEDFQKEDDPNMDSTKATEIWTTKLESLMD